MAPPAPAAAARLSLVLAAVLWSLGSVFMRLLREPTPFVLDDPALTPLQIAFYRGLFGGLVMLLLVRRRDAAFRPLMAGMVLSFSVMTCLYLSALALGPAANAIFLQNTAPVWVYLFAILVVGEAADRRGWQAVLLGGAGAVVIVAGNWPRDLPPAEHRSQVAILGMGAASGAVYAAVMIFLRVLRAESAAWLVALNLLGTAATLGLFVLVTAGAGGLWEWVSAPSARQLAVLAAFGAIQLAAPYWLFARGLRVVTPQEAGIITLLEPVLNPVWAFLITPEKDTPTGPMLAGGGFILAALVWRYLPAPRGGRTTGQSG